MIYEWKCPAGHIVELPFASSDEPVLCNHHDAQLKRYFGSVQLPRNGGAFQPHFNHSVGKYVSSARDFTDQLKRAGDEQSERTGITHSYVPVMPGDVPQPKESTEVFETRNKIVRDTNQTHEFGEIA